MKKSTLYHFALSSVIFSAVFLISCAPPPQHSCFFVRNSQKQRVSWSRNLPIVLWMNESIPYEYREAFYAAERAWENETGIDFFDIQEQEDRSDRHRADSRSVIYWLDEWSESKSSEQAKTIVHWAGSQIYDADILINAKDYSFYIDSESESDYSGMDGSRALHLESLMIHELGHVLGLDHNTDHRSVMLTHLSQQTVRNNIGSIDIESIQCEYGAYFNR